MNKSFSKIRHIQESNLMLEKRMLSEQNPNSGDTSSRVGGRYYQFVEKYLKLGYEEVNTITLPPGLYREILSGPVIDVIKNDGSDTGYIVILLSGGIRGQKISSVELKPDGTTILNGRPISNSDSMYNNPSDESEDSVVILKK